MNNDQRLSTALKERLQQFGAAPGEHSTANLDLMVQLRVIQNLHNRVHGPSFGIVSAIDQALDPCMHEGAGTHGARLNCSKQFAVSQTMVTNDCTSRTQGDDLGVGGGIGGAKVLVPSARKDATFADEDRANRDFSGLEGALGAA
jgi:hypothetical protein